MKTNENKTRSLANYAIDKIRGIKNIVRVI